jgi:hypothetical protein
MKKIVYSILTVIIFINSCNSPIEPEPQPGRRDYVWKVDTLAIPFMSFARIWGSAANDVWIVGPGGDLDKTIYHFDGISWKTDGISRPISPLSVWGFEKNNVWFGGMDGRIWHYDGANLKEHTRFETTREKNIGFQEVWGDSPSNIFAAGYSGDDENRTGIIAHFNGSMWELINFSNLKKYNFIRIRRANKESNTYYLWAIKDAPMTGDLVSIFEYNGGSGIKLIYEGKDVVQTSAFIQKIDNEMYFVIGNTINKYSDNEFKQFLQITIPNFGMQIFGRSKKDIFLRMLDGITHYNGSNLEYLYRFTGNISITDAFLFDKEVFFLALDLTNGNDLIFHGKLK